MCFGCYVEWIMYNSNRPRRNELKTLRWGWEFHPNFCYSYTLCRPFCRGVEKAMLQCGMKVIDSVDTLVVLGR